jgi:voltage-gated potassium channel Kch
MSYQIPGASLAHLVTETRATHPERVAQLLGARRRRPLLSPAGTLFLIAADHPARGVLAAGGDPLAMAARGDFLHRLLVALDRPGVDGVMATPDVVEELALLGALDGKVVFGSINRSGLAGAAFELDDRPTAYTAEAIAAAGLDGGKFMVRIDDQDPATVETMSACAATIGAFAARRLPIVVEVFATTRREGRVVEVEEPDALIRAIQIVAGLGPTSVYTWLKLPVVPEMDRVVNSTTLPTLLLGGDPGHGRAPFEGWRQALAHPQVRGLVAGRTLLYPRDGDVAAAVDRAASLVARRPVA